MLCNGHDLRDGKDGSLPAIVLQRPQEIFQPIEFDLVHGFEQLPKGTFRKTISLKPLQVKHRQVADVSAFVFPERHLHLNEFWEQGWIHFCVFPEVFLYDATCLTNL